MPPNDNGADDPPDGKEDRGNPEATDLVPLFCAEGCPEATEGERQEAADDAADTAEQAHDKLRGPAVVDGRNGCQ